MLANRMVGMRDLMKKMLGENSQKTEMGVCFLERENRNSVRL